MPFTMLDAAAVIKHRPKPTREFWAYTAGYQAELIWVLSGRRNGAPREDARSRSLSEALI